MLKVFFWSCSIALFVLPSAVARPLNLRLEGAELNWGRLEEWENRGTDLPPNVKAAVQHAIKSLDFPVEPVREFHLEGTLNVDAAHQRSDEAKSSFPEIFDTAICGRLAIGSDQGKCLRKLASTLLAWAHVYRSTGNPVNDAFFVPVLQSVDLLASTLSQDQSTDLRGWVHAFLLMGDRSFSFKPPTDPAWSNNWMASRILIRAMASRIARDANAEIETRIMLHDFAMRNFVLNDSGVRDGRTFDFIERDSLEYQVGDLLQLVQLALYTPDVVDSEVHLLICKGNEFLRPFYLRNRVHIEFQNTKVLFDKQRIDKDKRNPTFRRAAWNPSEANRLFILSRIICPEIRPWTENVLAARLDGWESLMQSIYN